MSSESKPAASSPAPEWRQLIADHLADYGVKSSGLYEGICQTCRQIVAKKGHHSTCLVPALHAALAHIEALQRQLDERRRDTRAARDLNWNGEGDPR